MKKKNLHAMKYGIILSVLLFMTSVLIGCGKEDTATETGQEESSAGPEITELPATGLAYETAKDTAVDIKALQAENTDVFAWLYIPGTDIDYPVLQSEEADDYYESHDKFGTISEEGALYTELANLKNMCDFNTVIHGKTSDGGESGLFKDLYQFADPDFFDRHEEAYLYIDGNLLTYEIFAAYEREDTSLIRTYDFTYLAGCQMFLDDLYDTRSMSMNLREGWDQVSPYHFLITLTTKKAEKPDTQFVVIGALVGDAAGTIDRAVIE